MNIKKFALCLKELGITENNFTNRKKLKSVAYLLELFGIDLDLKPFSWYMHGIYNPEITELLARVGN